jgi:hypothetical protein
MNEIAVIEKKAKNKSMQKGKRGEYRLLKYINTFCNANDFGIIFERIPLSGALNRKNDDKGDLICKDINLFIEVKNYSNLDLWSFPYSAKFDNWIKTLMHNIHKTGMHGILCILHRKIEYTQIIIPIYSNKISIFKLDDTFKGKLVWFKDDSVLIMQLRDLLNYISNLT